MGCPAGSALAEPANPINNPETTTLETFLANRARMFVMCPRGYAGAVSRRFPDGKRDENCRHGRPASRFCGPRTKDLIKEGPCIPGMTFT